MNAESETPVTPTSPVEPATTTTTAKPRKVRTSKRAEPTKQRGRRKAAASTQVPTSGAETGMISAKIPKYTRKPRKVSVNTQNGNTAAPTRRGRRAAAPVVVSKHGGETVVRVTIQAGGLDLSLAVDQAKDIHAALNALFGAGQ